MKVTLARMVETGLLTESQAKEMGGLDREVCATEEMFQDMVSRNITLNSIKTPEPTEAQIKLWNEQFDAMAKVKPSFLDYYGLGIGNLMYDIPPHYMLCRTPDPTDEEVKDWLHYHEYLGNMDWERARTLTQFIDTREPPYQDPDWWSWNG